MVLVVFLFLQTWRATLIPILTVPVSLIGVFALFPLLGFSINTLSLFGLVLAVGFVVDDAIVVVEAVERHIEEGMTARDATGKAIDEVKGPVVAIALSMAAVFVPVALIPGITGRLYQQFALTIAGSVLISAFTALSLSPALCAMLLRPRRASRGLLARFFGIFNRAFGSHTRGGYVRGASFLARKGSAPLVAGMLVAMGAATVFAGGRLPAGFVPTEDQGYLFVSAQLPDAASLQRTEAACKDVEAILATTPGIARYVSIAGFNLRSQSASTYSALFFVGLEPWERRKALGTSADEDRARAQQALSRSDPGNGDRLRASAHPGHRYRRRVRSHAAGPERRRNPGRPRRPDHPVRRSRQEASRDRGRVDHIPRRGPADLRPDRPGQGHKARVAVGDVYATLQAFMGNAYINEFNRFGRTWRVYLAAAPEYRVNAKEIDDFWVRAQGPKAAMVPLSSFVTIDHTAGPEFTNRYNLFRSAEITGSAAPDYRSGQAMKALEEVAQQTLPPDYSYAWSALSYQEASAPRPVPTFSWRSSSCS